MSRGEYWSIGEVLSLLQDEFPEITISKIRFLESQGLIQPERTPSGYRRFYQGDFDLLQWILVQQRDHYLPLKVIRDRIESGDLDPAVPSSIEAAPFEAPAVEDPAVEDPVSEAPAVAFESVAEPLVPEEPAAEPSEIAPNEPVSVQPMPVEPDSPESDVSDQPAPPLALTRDELAESSGCSPKMVADLERYGLVKGRKAGPTVLYDQTALLITRIASQFDAFGLEPRHLRTFLIGAEREVGLVYQVVEPMLHRRDEETRRKAHETLDDLTDLAGSLRSVLMRQAAEELLPKR